MLSPALGILSDTHGLLRPGVLQLFQGCSAILHAGDVGDIAILSQLAKVAPVTAIRGNIDVAGATAQLPATEMFAWAGTLVYVLHSIHDLDLEPQAAGVTLVVSGHSHQPSVETRNGVTYLNPGSCGPRRFRLPITVARARWVGGAWQVGILDVPTETA